MARQPRLNKYLYNVLKTQTCPFQTFIRDFGSSIFPSLVVHLSVQALAKCRPSSEDPKIVICWPVLVEFLQEEKEREEKMIVFYSHGVTEKKLCFSHGFSSRSHCEICAILTTFHKWLNFLACGKKGDDGSKTLSSSFLTMSFVPHHSFSSSSQLTESIDCNGFNSVFN